MRKARPAPCRPDGPRPLVGPSRQSKTGTTIGQFLYRAERPHRRHGKRRGGSPRGSRRSTTTPAPSARIDGLALQFTHSDWIADIAYDYAAVVLPPQALRQLLRQRDRTELGRDRRAHGRAAARHRGTLHVQDLALGLGYGRPITDRFAAGLRSTTSAETIWHSSLSTVTFNIGTLYRLTAAAPQLGASISNFGLRRGSTDATWRSSTTPIPTNTATTARSRPISTPTSSRCPCCSASASATRSGSDATNRLLLAVDAYPPQRQRREHEPRRRVDIQGHPAPAGRLPEPVPRRIPRWA